LPLLIALCSLLFGYAGHATGNTKIFIFEKDLSQRSHAKAQRAQRRRGRKEGVVVRRIIVEQDES